MKSVLFCRRESKIKEEFDGIDTKNLLTLERLKQNQRQDYLKVWIELCDVIMYYSSEEGISNNWMFQGAVSGSVQATDRLMKELREIYRSDSFKKGILLLKSQCLNWQYLR